MGWNTRISMLKFINQVKKEDQQLKVMTQIKIEIAWKGQYPEIQNLLI
jgi:hypothetical protein